jgi:hypothetical protein
VRSPRSGSRRLDDAIFETSRHESIAVGYLTRLGSRPSSEGTAKAREAMSSALERWPSGLRARGRVQSPVPLFASLVADHHPDATRHLTLTAWSKSHPCNAA